MAVDDSFTKSLLHFTGSDASTSFTDESGKVWTAGGNAQLDTAQYKFQPSSGLFDGSGDWIETPDHADFDLGSGDFTFDFWIRSPISSWVSKAEYIFGKGTSFVFGTNYSFYFECNNGNMVFNYSDGSSNFFLNSGGMSQDNWNHVAIVRNSSSIISFKDGVLVSGVPMSATVNNDVGKMSIGRRGEDTATTFTGWIDEFRVSKGIARWTTEFTPPSYPYAPFPPVGSSVSKLHIYKEF